MTMKRLSWAQIDEAADELVAKIKASGFEADYIIGITRGGLIPLGLLSKRLDVKKILTVSARSYNKKKKGELEITYMPDVDLAEKKLLLVDEIADTGNTLHTIADMLVAAYKPRELRTATLIVNTDRCEFYPDFWVLAETGDWIAFPWEKEDVFPPYKNA